MSVDAFPPQEFAPNDAAGTWDFGNTREDRANRDKARAHALVHYQMPQDGQSQCPYCGALLLKKPDEDEG